MVKMKVERDDAKAWQCQFAVQTQRHIASIRWSCHLVGRSMLSLHSTTDPREDRKYDLERAEKVHAVDSIKNDMVDVRASGK